MTFKMRLIAADETQDDSSKLLARSIGRYLANTYGYKAGDEYFINYGKGQHSVKTYKEFAPKFKKELENLLIGIDADYSIVKSSGRMFTNTRGTIIRFPKKQENIDKDALMALVEKTKSKNVEKTKSKKPVKKSNKVTITYSDGSEKQGTITDKGVKSILVIFD